MIETTLKIDGMACSMCEAHVNNAIRSAFAVKKVASSHSKGQTVIVSEASLDRAKLIETVGKTGYRILDITENPYEKKSLFSFFKK